MTHPLRRIALAAVSLLAVISAATRLPALRQLPVFGDEAIFLRLARLVRDDPSRNLWLPLDVPNAPLHAWLLALFLPLSSDPVRAGRLLSVLCGVLLVPIFAWTVWRAGSLLSEPAKSRFAGIAAAALAATSPFFAFSQRLARVDALFALEVALVTGLALELAFRARQHRPVLAWAILFGLVMGSTMLTRQAVSYLLWLVAPIAFFALRGPGGARRLGVPLAVAAAVAFALWLPMLRAPAWPDLATRVFHLAGARPSLAPAERVSLLLRNAELAAQSFWTYLTPPVFVVCLGGLVWLARPGRRRLLGFLLFWELLLLAPAALFAGDYFPRYALPAALPLLAAAGFAFAGLWSRAKAESAALLVAVALSSAVDVWRGERDWKSWRLLPIDRMQFVSGWSAGAASEATVAFLAGRAEENPISVVLPQVSGNPSDSVWLLLEKNPRVRLFYAEDFLRLPALRVKGDVWIHAPARGVDPDRPVFFISPDPVFLGRDGWAPARGAVLRLNPDARKVACFENPPDEHGRVASAVEVFRLR